MKDIRQKRAPRGRIIIGAIIGVLLIPTAVVAAGGAFTDDETSVFEADINWLAEAEVTLGCNPPTNDLFCPDDNVTRGQMAAFMRRFAATAGQAGSQVVDFNSPLDASIEIVETLTVDATAITNSTVSLNAHVYLEKTAASEGRYDISIRRDDCAGTVVGSTFWRSAENSEASFIADTIALTGFDTVEGSQTYALCVEVFTGPEVSINMRGLTATWSPTS
ncbi:MAG: S-layer homology domain-containing protein [Acidimicrobiia bacterium]